MWIICKLFVHLTWTWQNVCFWCERLEERRALVFFLSTHGAGWGGVKFLHIERKITSVVHSHPPSHYIRTHAFLPTTWLLMMFVHYPPFPQITSFWYIHIRLHKSYPPLHSPYPDSHDYRMTIGTRKNQPKNARAWAPQILHEKTQRFLRGWQDWHINLKSRWSPGAFYMRKHNDLSGVGGGGI